ncbi:unnamed protein product [Adineta ricciae]|uniref:F-box domain-containing protein n=1 Tax=Adineta ricciae TaxID=249248 RepID=A0A814FJF0_ADIRI|nr:unnamed protein product [Adineta ricciae]CAF1286788.1 unnamed protein product [Adineta ricciae]
MPSPTMFDRFPTELFFETFRYLTTYDILHAFKDLNQHINMVLRNYYKYDLNFQSWSKGKFDFVRESISPEQIQSLVLSDEDDTVRQIHLFFRLLYIRRFVNLKSLTLIAIDEQDWKKIQRKLHFLSNLTSLSLRLSQHLSSISVELPLKSLVLNTCTTNELHQWLVHTPMLINLEVELIVDVSDNDFRLNPIGTNIRRLKIKLPEKSHITFEDLEALFVCMPKVKFLTMTVAKGFRLFHGDRWEDLLRRYLPHLEDFRFKIHPALDNVNPTQLISAFQTPFWLHEHQWIVHCDFHGVHNRHYRNVNNIHFYTLPYPHDQFYLTTSTKSLTNHSKDAFQTVKELYLSIDSDMSTHLLEHFYFPDLDSLIVCNLHELPSLIDLINLSRIKHLTIEQNNPIQPQEFFLHILVYTINLRSLKISWHSLMEITREFTNQNICSILEKQIKHLHVFDCATKISPDKGKQVECLIKLFSKNLEKLNVHVPSLDNIAMLLNEMLKLNSMAAEYESKSNKMDSDRLLSWLTENVPKLKKFTHQIRYTSKSRVQLLFWMSL